MEEGTTNLFKDLNLSPSKDEILEQVSNAIPKYDKEEVKNDLYKNLIRDLFLVKDITKKYTRETLKQYQFILNRRIAIKYPVEVNRMNIIGIDPKYSAYELNILVRNGYGPERWVWTAGAKKAKEEKAKKEINPNLIKDFCVWYNVSPKDVESALEIFKEDMEKELIDFKDMQKKMNEK